MIIYLIIISVPGVLLLATVHIGWGPKGQCPPEIFPIISYIFRIDYQFVFLPSRVSQEINVCVRVWYVGIISKPP